MFLYFLSLTILLIGCFSCNPVKQATKYYVKAKEKHLPTVALLSQKDWPCGESKRDTVTKILPGKKDTVIVPQVVMADCPDTATNAAPGSIIKVPVKVPCNCLQSDPDTVYSEITSVVKDPRDSIYYTYQIRSVNKELASTTQGRNTWRTMSLILLGLAALSIFLFIKKIKIV
jgi:hypothetical protein